MRDLTLNQQEQTRIQVLNSVLEYQLPIAQAAEIMGLSQRHTKRLLAAYRRDGPAALAHGNRDRRPHNAVPEAAVAAVVKLANNTYAGANHTHFTELLRDREGIDLSRPTVRRILAKAGMGSPRSRRSSQHRFRRRRMPQEGMLVQIDGSHHPWLEERGDQRQLLLPVDADYSCRSWGETIWYRRYRIGHRSAGSATEAEANGRQGTTSGGGGIWYERADGADVAARQAAVGEEGQAEVANPTGPVRRGVGRGGRAPSAERR